jgi:hypothetical protein
MGKTRNTGFSNNAIQYNSGSISFISGSTTLLNINATGSVKYGLVSSNTHQFTGSLNVTGALYVATGSVGIGTVSPSQLFEVVGGEVKAGRVDSSQEGGQVSFGRSTDNATAWYIDAYGSTASPQFRFINVTNAAVVMTMTGSNVGIGVSSPVQTLHLKAAAGSTTGLRLESNGGTTNFDILSSEGDGNVYLYQRSNYNILFGTNNTERMRITNDNVVLIGTTSTSPSNSGGMIFRATNAAYGGVIIMNHSTTNNVGAGYLDLYYNTSYIGGISQNGASNVLFNTSSDYRLKEDLKDFNGLNLVSNLKVYDFKWKAENSRMYGVIAHELQEVIPYAVSGNKDEMKEDGIIKVQVVDYSKLTPVLVKAIQELKAQNDALKTRIETLENK